MIKLSTTTLNIYTKDSYLIELVSKIVSDIFRCSFSKSSSYSLVGKAGLLIAAGSMGVFPVPPTAPPAADSLPEAAGSKISSGTVPSGGSLLICNPDVIVSDLLLAGACEGTPGVVPEPAPRGVKTGFLSKGDGMG